MKTSWKKFAPFGLYLALLAGLASGGLYIVRRAFDLPLQISLGLVVLGLALYAILDPRKLRENLTGRQARYGSNALILTIAVIGILVVLNVFVNTNSPRVDLTADKENTLAKESLEVLASLKDSVRADAYYSSRQPTSSAQELLDRFKRASNGKFDYRFIDPEADPVSARSAGITRDGTIVLVQGERSEQVSFAGESEVVNALVRLDNPGQRSIYFLTGHGEYEVEGQGQKSYSTLKSTLQGKNYTVKPLNLYAERVIPEDALTVVIPGPETLLSQEEVDLLRAYLDRGGSLVLLSEPPFVTKVDKNPDPLAAYLETTWGIRLGADIIINPNYDPANYAIAASYGQHPITEKMSNLTIALPSARSVQPAQASSADITSTLLALTAQNSWAETGVDEITGGQVKFDQNQDTPGPVGMAIAAQNASTKARVIVVGDSDFGGNSLITLAGNEVFLVNAIDWASGQENLINLTPRQTTQRVLILRDTVLINLLLLGTVIVMPGVVVVAGIVVWLNRRKRG